MDTPKLLLTAKLALPPWRPILDDGPEISIGFMGACLLTNVRPGIWIAGTCIHHDHVPFFSAIPGSLAGLVKMPDIPHCSLVLLNAADMNMVRCPVCNLNKCEGDDARLVFVLGPANVVLVSEFGLDWNKLWYMDDAILDVRHCKLYLRASSGMGPGSMRTSAVTLAMGSWILPPPPSSTTTTSIAHVSKVCS